MFTKAIHGLDGLFASGLWGFGLGPLAFGFRSVVLKTQDQRPKTKDQRPTYLNSQFLTSVKCPLIAAAAAIMGLTKCVRPPRPCRPSKFRLLGEAQRSPGCKMPAFIPRHIEQPASRHSNPASLKTRPRPSRSAAFFTS